MPRKKPFSNKQKKKQLQVKRERKRGDTGSGPSSRNASVERGGERQSDTSDSETTDIRRINQQPFGRDGRHDPNRFRLHFEKESKEEVIRRKKLAMETVLKPASDKELEVNINEIYPSEKGLGFPRRPSWTYEMSRESLMRKEEKSFRDYLEELHSRNPPGSLSHFEHNLETWRQLWRVLEMSDVILVIVDIRHPVLQFPPDLYRYITADLHKQMILVLNKADLCPPPLVIAWKHYMTSQFPHLEIVCFTSHPGQSYNTVLQKKRMRKKADWSRPGGLIDIFKACQEITAGKVDLSSWEQKIHRDAVAERLDGESHEDGAESVLVEHQTDSTLEMSNQELYKDGVLTLGCIGFPNVGKSSVINSLVGRKVVSVSRTPGHTKYFQTYYLTPTVKMCDCPGLVFPSCVNKQLQILAGIYPVAQLQEPYTSVGYLCERTPYLSVLKLKHPSLQEKGSQQERHGTTEPSWTAWEVCEAWAERRGYKTAKAARNDVYRAANSLLRLAIDGRLCLCLRPPGYSCLKEHWENHPDLPDIMALQGRAAEEEGSAEREDEEDGESSSEPEEERDRDADDDEDGDDEDEGFGHQGQNVKKPSGFTINMYNVLREKDCE
ncbi:PREDICTED: guanine nucleotide-binding protein-like 1 [Cyprinodon variegatus]|uniref:Guanine nucleotide-binding protein-like 1 n=1 Tax=Cyprinodon variegatus TaxID=28743 RepID=A0A3Q2DJH5_CYPVA|nr:PREDICTED: guanine nucleotide-binding protein-like 1 [Cyprinodon variegatus]